ncbi:hypothetical protein PGLA_10130 [Paenibacillus glacialis]|uniref:Uncharacterized protein n=1 Tax=Paenibacillus glacialis TaxID=494026 RepID=A0A162K4B4_9BACL|nr:hypothetical protein PGLA_10130 [Paenibacillus glacialis]
MSHEKKLGDRFVSKCVKSSNLNGKGLEQMSEPYVVIANYEDNDLLQVEELIGENLGRIDQPAFI